MTKSLHFPSQKWLCAHTLSVQLKASLWGMYHTFALPTECWNTDSFQQENANGVSPERDIAVICSIKAGSVTNSWQIARKELMKHSLWDSQNKHARSEVSPNAKWPSQNKKCPQANHTDIGVLYLSMPKNKFHTCTHKTNKTQVNMSTIMSFAGKAFPVARRTLTALLQQAQGPNKNLQEPMEETHGVKCN